MHVGVPKEVKNHEYRVEMTPTSVSEMVAHRHKVTVVSNCGAGIGSSDDDYRSAGADVVNDAVTIFEACDMIVKVKEPQAIKRKMLREGQLLFTYLHLASGPEQTKDLVDSGAVCIVYETITGSQGGLPLLAPCQRWQTEWPFRLALMRWNIRMVGWAFCWAGYPGLIQLKS